MISTSVKYDPFIVKQEIFGKKNGYQFMWKEAQADVKDTLVQLTFLEGRTYYTISSLVAGKGQVFFTRTGANDPNFNLRHEPALIIRKNGTKQSFVNVTEIHGNFDPVLEYSSNSYSSVQQIKLLVNDENITVAEIVFAGKKLIIAQCNNDFNPQSSHSYNKDGLSIKWNGPYSVLYDGKILK